MQNLFNMINLINIDVEIAKSLLKENQDEIKHFNDTKEQVSYKSKKDTIAQIKKAAMIVIAGLSARQCGYGFVCVMKDLNRIFVEADIEKVNEIISKH